MARRPGFSLIELLVVITVFALVLTAAGRLMVTTQGAFVAQREAATSLVPLRQAETVLTELFQAAGANPSGIKSVATGRQLPGIYALSQSGRAAYYQLVSDLTPTAVNSLDAEFEDVQTWVAGNTLWVSWRNQAGTPAAAQAVASPIDSVRYTFVNAVGDTLAAVTNGQVTGASRVRIRIWAPRLAPSGPISIARDTWVLLRN